MLVFRDAPAVPTPAAAVYTAVRREASTLEVSCFAVDTASHDAAVALLVDAGMLEAAIADDEQGRDGGLARRARAVTLAAARAAAASWHDDPAGVRRAAGEVSAAVDAVAPSVSSRMLRLRTPEGYAYYGLYPETYLEAARAVFERRRPRTAAIVGIRSIGTSLSAIVAAELERHGCACTSSTVRPAGHPFERQVTLDAEAATLLTSGLAEGPAPHGRPDLAIVADEGPGLSGSSLAAAVDAISRAGMPLDRIVVLPAHDPEPSRLRSATAARVWPQLEKEIGSFEHAWLGSGRLGRASGLTPVADLSAGGWRAWCGGAASALAVQPQHERRKYLARDAGGRMHLLKFAGVGRFGRALADRARRLAGTAAADCTARLAAGFTWRPIIEGGPVGCDGVDDALVRTAAAYLRDVSKRFATGHEADGEPLAHMLEVNARELFPGARLERLPAILRQARRCASHPAVRLDARMLPHEWIRTANGTCVKVDALEHHDDHFYPGPHDVAWDAAGTIVEFRLPRAARRAFLARLRPEAGPLDDRLEFFTASYLAFRAAYCLMGAGALGDSTDGRRLAAAAARYRAQLRGVLTGQRAVIS